MQVRQHRVELGAVVDDRHATRLQSVDRIPEKGRVRHGGIKNSLYVLEQGYCLPAEWQGLEDIVNVRPVLDMGVEKLSVLGFLGGGSQFGECLIGLLELSLHCNVNINGGRQLSRQVLQSGCFDTIRTVRQGFGDPVMEFGDCATLAAAF